MILHDLSPSQLAERLRTRGVLLRMGPFIVRLGTRLRELAAPIALLYADYPLVDEGGLVDFDVRVEAAAGVRRWAWPRARLAIDARPDFQLFRRRIALPMIEWAVNWCTFTRPHCYLMLHSVAVARGGRAMLLPGPPGAGKSTLCAAMIHRGWRLLSDELALMRPGEIDLIPVPRPVGLKEESIDVIRRFAPQAVIGPACTGTHKGAVAHVKPPGDSIRLADRTARPRWVVFPAYRAGQPTTLAPFSKAQTFLHVADDSFNFSVLGEAAFDTLANLIDACDCYELRYGDLGEAVGMLNDLADQGTTAEMGAKANMGTTAEMGAIPMDIGTSSQPCSPAQRVTRLHEQPCPDPHRDGTQSHSRGTQSHSRGTRGLRDKRAIPLVLLALRRPETVASLSPADWDALLRRAREAGVLSRLAYLVHDAGLTDGLEPRVRDHLAGARAVAGQHERIVRWEVSRIRRALAATGVDFVLLKGAAYVLARLPPARGRLVSDVDILVPSDRLGEVEAALVRHGWEAMKLHPYDQRYYRTWMHELPPLRHRHRGSVVDVHHTILPVTGRLHPDPRKLLAAARPIQGDGLRVLAPVDMVLHSAAHLFQDGDLAGGLRDLADLDGLLRHFSRAEPGFWEGLVPRAVELQLARPLYYALHFAGLLLGTPVPERVVAGARVGRPAWPLRCAMDFLATRALVPAEHVPGAGLAQYLLYVRSHWLRMPPLLLAQHLARKAARRWAREDSA